MKTRILFVAAIALLLNGCAYFGNEAQYKEGDWYGLAGPREVAKIQRDKLAIAKLQMQPVKTGVMTPQGAVPSESAAKQEPTPVSAGYYGIIANMSPYKDRRYLFKYWGPETGAIYLKSGEKKPMYLLPGHYYGEIYYGGYRTGWANFNSEPQEKHFDGEKVHWMFYAEY